MECNKDEAIRAKEVAEKLFLARDISAAKRFALKAQNLYPGLEGLSQMLAALDVNLSAETKINEEADWYAILGVTPLADDETVKKQYRKLALVLHPDKNKAVGADEAFKMISQAWSVLSDKTLRAAYDHRRVLRTSQHTVTSASGGPSAAPSGANGFHNFSKPPSTNVGTQKNKMKTGSSTASTPAPDPAPVRSSKPKTFWTACHRCKMQYEYLRVYLNHNLLCPNCHEAFLALETAAPPAKNSKSSNPPPWNGQSRQDSNLKANKNVGSAGFSTPDSFNQQWVPFSRTSGVGSATASPSAAAQATNAANLACEKAKREREARTAAKRKEALQKKANASNKRAASNLTAGFFNADSRPDSGGERPSKKTNLNVNVSRQNVTGNGGAGTGNASGFQQGGFYQDRANALSVPNSKRDLPQLELRNMLEENARRAVRALLIEWRLVAASGDRLEKEKGKHKEGEKDKEMTPTNGNIDEVVECVDTQKGVQDKKTSHDIPGVDLHSQVREPLSISVPDPDFHDFDRDRSERCFGENQVWAAYDNDDGMPRYYAIIHKVISVNPFKMRISWLNSKTNNELGPLNWVGSGFLKTCGDFRVGRYENNTSLNSFSHKVRWTKGTRGAVKIFPRKGDVWSLYRNWSPDWSELTPDDVIHKYDMVEVLDDYDEEQGVFVTPLVKVAGFKTVFHRHLDEREVRRIPREEMFRFSHQVPSYLLTGSEAHNAPKGFRELDPAATPLDLLRVITDVTEEEMVGTCEVMVDNAEGQTVTVGKGTEIVENAGEGNHVLAGGDTRGLMVETAEEKNLKEQPVC